jgi:hypothetical protein
MPAMIDTGYDYIGPNGRGYPVTRRNGLFFIYDPKHELTLERQSVLQFMAAAAPAPAHRSGLGVIPGGVIQAASTAANFIPGVGPFISAGIQILGGLFGGGDPTALSVLIDQIVQLREQIAEANRSMGVADNFSVPAGFNAQDKDTWRDFVDGIVMQALGTTEEEIQGNRRPDMYSAIDALKRGLAAVQKRADNAQLAQTIEQQILAAQGNQGTGGMIGTGAGDGSEPSSSAPAASSSSSMLPILLAGAAAVYFATSRR